METDKKIEFLNSYMRVLTLLFGFREKKSFQMTFDKLILYDFYLKYPITMFGEKEREQNYDFEELYSYFHSEPDRDSYYKILRFLMAKRLICRNISKGSFIYQITILGEELVKSIESPYGFQLIKYSNQISNTVSKQSDIYVKDAIYIKSKENIKYSY
jgi:hypothetical protein